MCYLLHKKVDGRSKESNGQDLAMKHASLLHAEEIKFSMKRIRDQLSYPKQVNVNTLTPPGKCASEGLIPRVKINLLTNKCALQHLFLYTPARRRTM